MMEGNAVHSRLAFCRGGGVPCMLQENGKEGTPPHPEGQALDTPASWSVLCLPEGCLVNEFSERHFGETAIFIFSDSVSEEVRGERELGGEDRRERTRVTQDDQGVDLSWIAGDYLHNI